MACVLAGRGRLCGRQFVPTARSAFVTTNARPAAATACPLTRIPRGPEALSPALRLGADRQHRPMSRAINSSSPDALRAYLHLAMNMRRPPPPPAGCPTARSGRTIRRARSDAATGIAIWTLGRWPRLTRRSPHGRSVRRTRRRGLRVAMLVTVHVPALKGGFSRARESSRTDARPRESVLGEGDPSGLADWIAVHRGVHIRAADEKSAPSRRRSGHCRPGRQAVVAELTGQEVCGIVRLTSRRVSLRSGRGNLLLWA